MATPEDIGYALGEVTVGVQMGNASVLNPVSLFHDDRREEWSPEELAELYRQLEEMFNLTNLVRYVTSFGETEWVAETQDVGLFISVDTAGRTIFIMAPPDFDDIDLEE